MYNVDPMMLIQAIRNGQNPQQLLMGVLENQMGGTPLGQNLIQLAKQGRGAEIEQIVRNIYVQNGKNFDSEFNAFKRQYFGK